MRKVLLFMFSVLPFINAGAENRMEKDVEVVKKSETDDGLVKHLTKAEFLQKVYNYEKNPDAWKYEGDKPAIIDFYATWCGPCKRVAPILEELAKEYEGKILIYKIDTDKEKELASAFGIRSIPTLLFIPKTGDPQMAQGAMPKEGFKKAIDEFLLGDEK